MHSRRDKRETNTFRNDNKSNWELSWKLTSLETSSACLPLAARGKKKVICTSLRIFCRKQHLWTVKALTAGSVFNCFQGMSKETLSPSWPRSWIDWKRIPWEIHWDFSQNSLKNVPFLGTDLQLLDFLRKNKVISSAFTSFSYPKEKYRNWGALSLRRCALPSAFIPKRLLLLVPF